MQGRLHNLVPISFQIRTVFEETAVASLFKDVEVGPLENRWVTCHVDASDWSTRCVEAFACLLFQVPFTAGPVQHQLRAAAPGATVGGNSAFAARVCHRCQRKEQLALL